MLVSWCLRHLQFGKVIRCKQAPRLRVCYLSIIYHLNRSLRRLADHGDKVSLQAFIKGLHDIQMGSVDEATKIFKAFDTDFTGYINMKEFLFDVRYLTQVKIYFLKQSVQSA